MGPRRPPATAPTPHGTRTEEKAAISLVLGLASLGCLGPAVGLPAMILGALARRDIDRSNGTLTGRAIAAGGIVSGFFGTGIGIVVMLWAVGALFAPDAPETTTEANASAPMAAAAADDPPPARLAVAPGVRTYGSVEVVDLDDARSLRAQLVEIVRRSHGRTVVLQTYMKKSATCDAVAAALPDKRMQLALANVTLVLVDVDDFDEELHEMSIETATAPWFYKLDAEADPSDAISADAWGAKAPDQMAAALARFMRRRPARR